MAVFIAVVNADGEAGYTASFPDFPRFAVDGPTLEVVIARAREMLLAHIAKLVEAGQPIAVPRAAETIDRGGALLLAAVDVPDDIGLARVELTIPGLALARIDLVARRLGLTRAALFVQAVDRWEARNQVRPERRDGPSDGPTLLDFSNPLDVKVGSVAADPALLGASQPGGDEAIAVQETVGDITAELMRLLEEGEQAAAEAEIQSDQKTHKRK